MYPIPKTIWKEHTALALLTPLIKVLDHRNTAPTERVRERDINEGRKLELELERERERERHIFRIQYCPCAITLFSLTILFIFFFLLHF